MKRYYRYVVLIMLLLGFSQVAYGQQPAPTLVPPTPIPYAENTQQDVRPSQSAVARIQANGVVKVGILYNSPPFSERNLRGDYVGFDADLARIMAETWGVEAEFIQVTRDALATAYLLSTEQIDMVISAQTHYRSLDSVLLYSHTYYLGHQVLMVREEDPATDFSQMAGRSIGVVIASPSEAAAYAWNTRHSINATITTYFTLDRAYAALVAGDIDGLVDNEYRLHQQSLARPDLIRILDVPVDYEPFAVVVQHDDLPMRDLVNHTLQFLMSTGKLNEIHQVYFLGEAYDGVSVWTNLSEHAPVLSQYNNELSERPSAYQIQEGRTIRVAGLEGVTADSNATESQRRLDAFHREILTRMAAQWGVTIEFLPNSIDNAFELIATGQADIAVGIHADWNWADRLYFTGQYLLHGKRLMVRVNDPINQFTDLRGGKVVIIPDNDPRATELAISIAETVNSRIEIEHRPEGDLAFTLLADTEVFADAVFGDSLKLIPHVQENSTLLRLTTEGGEHGWYSPSLIDKDGFEPLGMVMAVSRQDVEFYLAVEYALQDLVRDGTLHSLLQPLMLFDEIPTFEIWPD